MPRARLLKPSFFTNEVLGKLPMGARLVFQGLWCVSDRRGRLEDRPAKLKVEILPYDKADINKLLDLLADNGFILRYESGGKRFIQVLKFEKHQSCHVREPESTIPAPGQHWASLVPVSVEHQSGPAEALTPNPLTEAEAEAVAFPPTPLPAAAATETSQILALLVNEYENTFGTLSKTMADRLQEWAERIPPGLAAEACLRHAFEQAAVNNVRKFRYVEVILESHEANGWQWPESRSPAEEAITDDEGDEEIERRRQIWLKAKAGEG